MPTTKVICTICLKENLTSADVTMLPLPFPGVFLVNLELDVLVPCSNSIRTSLNYSLESCGKNVKS